MRKRAQRDLHSARRVDVNVFQSIWTLAKARIYLHHHVILVLVLIHDRDLPLAKSGIERAVDRSRRNSQSRSCVTVNDYGGFEPMILLIARDVTQFGHSSHFFVEARGPGE